MSKTSAVDVVVGVEQRADGWWVVVKGGPDASEVGPAPSEEEARAHAADTAELLAELYGTRPIVGNPARPCA